MSPPPPPQLLHPPPPSPGFELHKAALYVGDLDPEVSEVELVDVFSGMGPLVSVRLCRDSLSGKSLCYAYVNFFYPSDGNPSLSLSLARAFSILSFLAVAHAILRMSFLFVVYVDFDGFLSLFVKCVFVCVVDGHLGDLGHGCFFSFAFLG